MNTNTGWKWATLILVMVLLMLLSCCVGMLFGGTFAWRLAAYSRPMLYHQPMMPEMPEMPTAPVPPEAPARPWMGLAFQMVDEGAQVVLLVPDGPADVAGVRVGDVVIAVNERDVTLSHPLDARLQPYTPGDRVRLTILRDGKVGEIDVRLAVRPDESAPAPGWDG